jgi:hypothetical protein
MITISGSLTIQDNTGQQHTINADDFQCERNLTQGEEYDVSYDTGDWSVNCTVENKNGAMSWGDWEVENCTIVNDRVSFSIN